jgi:hypothetical protein
MWPIIQRRKIVVSTLMMLSCFQGVQPNLVSSQHPIQVPPDSSMYPPLSPGNEHSTQELQLSSSLGKRGIGSVLGSLMVNIIPSILPSLVGSLFSKRDSASQNDDPNQRRRRRRRPRKHRFWDDDYDLPKKRGMFPFRGVR